MEISQCHDSIAIEAFQNGIKRETILFVKLTKTTPCFPDAIYQEAYKFFIVKMELKSSKSSLILSSNKPTTIKKEEDWKPFY